MHKTPFTKKDNEHREKVNWHRYLEYLRGLGIDPADAGRAFACLTRAFSHLEKKQAAKIVLHWVEESKSRTITSKQNLLIRQALDIILADTILLQRTRNLTAEEKGWLKEMSRRIHSIAEILEQAKVQEPKKFLKGILKDLKGIQGIL